MDIDKIKDLMEMMKANDLSELEVVDGQTRIVLKRSREANGVPVVVHSSVSPVAVPSAQVSSAAMPATPETPKQPAANLLEIKSPIVGTFYTSPSPNADPFVKVGQHVDDETVVCIVEAMKVMNEVKAEVRGTIKKVLTSNGQAVEFGQPLFLVEPD